MTATLTKEAAQRRAQELRAKREALRVERSRLIEERRHMFQQPAAVANATAGKAVAEQLKQVEAELEMVMGELVGDVDAAPIGKVVIDTATADTAATLRTRRQADIQERARKVLKAAGGSMRCVDVARLVGVSAHGLGGLIDNDPMIEKRHQGRLQNLETVYRLKQP